MPSTAKVESFRQVCTEVQVGSSQSESSSKDQEEFLDEEEEYDFEDEEQDEWEEENDEDYDELRRLKRQHRKLNNSIRQKRFSNNYDPSINLKDRITISVISQQKLDEETAEEVQ